MNNGRLRTRSGRHRRSSARDPSTRLPAAGACAGNDRSLANRLSAACSIPALPSGSAPIPTPVAASPGLHGVRRSATTCRSKTTTVKTTVF